MSVLNSPSFQYFFKFISIYLEALYAQTQTWTVHYSIHIIATSYTVMHAMKSPKWSLISGQMLCKHSCMSHTCFLIRQQCTCMTLDHQYSLNCQVLLSGFHPKKKKFKREKGMEVLHTVSPPLPNKPLILIKMYITILRLFN